MIPLNFYRVSEKMPGHDDEIVWCSRHNDGPWIGTVERYWDEVDSRGTSTGFTMTETNRDVEIHEDPELMWVRRAAVNGVEMEPSDLWIDIKTYRKFVVSNSNQ